MMQALWQDFRYAVRLLLKKPGFTAIAVLTLALGISVNATMFSMVSAFLLRRPPVHQSDRIVVVSSVNPNPVFLPDAYPVSAPNYLAWREASQVLSSLAAADDYRTVNLTLRGQAEALPAAAVSPNYFDLLGVAPQLGRTFSEGEDQPGRDHVVILSHELWVRRFASDPAAVGRTVRLNRENYVVAGIMPAKFSLLGYTPRLWIPLGLTAEDQAPAVRKDRSLRLFGRLKPGTTLEQARAEFTTLGNRAVENFPESEKGWGVSVRTLPDFLIYSFGIRQGLAIMMTAVGLVLLIACGNVAGLLLSRAAGRQKELAVRISMGASRWRVVRQLLTEGLLIAILGGVAGLLFAAWGIRVVAAGMTFNEAMSAVPLRLDRNVLWFASVVSILSAALCALVPALKASRTDVNSTLKDDSRTSSAGQSHARLRTLVITGEIALALFLLVGTGLLLRGLYVLEHQNPGFQPDHVLTAAITLDNTQYKDTQQQIHFVRAALPQIQSIPGVAAVAMTSDLPATGPSSVTFHIKGQPESPAQQPLTTLDMVVTQDFFLASGIPLLRGRTFGETDDSTARKVVVVSHEFVHRLLHDEEPLGKQIRLDVSGATGDWSEIVGVVGDVKTNSEGVKYDPQVYEPYLQRPVASFALMVRTTRDPNTVAADLRNAVAQVDAELPLDRVMSMPAVIDRQKGGDELFTRMLGLFAVLALALAAIGIYGLIAYSVAQRSHEIGIRMALGAEKSDVLRIVLGQGLKMTGIGAGVGLLLALPLPKVYEAMFVDVHFGEPWLYVLVPVAILLVAMFATYIPARRATRVDPMVALRYE